MRHKKPKRGGPLGPHADRREKPTGLAARVIAWRLGLGLSQEKAAKLLGVARRTLAAWELGRLPRGLYARVLEETLAKSKGGRRGRGQ